MTDFREGGPFWPPSVNSLEMPILNRVNEIKRLKSLQKVEAYLEPKRASMMKRFCEYTKRLTIFTVKAPS